MDLKKDTLIIKLLWWSHLAVVIGLYILFFIRKKLIQEISTINLYYMLWVALSQAFWGIFMIKHRGSFALVCPMTTLMQYLRGYPVNDEKNHGHSYVVEFMDYLGVKWDFALINKIMIGTIIAVILRFVFF